VLTTVVVSGASAGCSSKGEGGTGREETLDMQPAAGALAVASVAAAGPMDSVKAPSEHEVIRVLFRQLDRPLAADSTCAGVGARSDDRTIGDFLAGFLAAQADSSGANWVQVTSTRVTAGAAAWRHDVLLRRRAGEEEWAWGVRFDQRVRDRGVEVTSMQCLGG